MKIAVNKYNGETKLKVYGIDYPMRWNAKTYFEFASETGIDPNALFMDAINELNQLKSSGAFEESPEVANSILMARLSAVITASHAAWLFYIAAKEMDAAVTFEEFQEAVLLEGVSQSNHDPDGELVKTYPYLVIEFAVFAMGLTASNDVKKKNSGHLFIDLLRRLF